MSRQREMLRAGRAANTFRELLQLLQKTPAGTRLFSARNRAKLEMALQKSSLLAVAISVLPGAMVHTLGFYNEGPCLN